VIGRLVGNRYKILRQIGTSEVAWGYMAEDTAGNSQVVVKVLFPQYVENVAYAQRFTREAKIAMSIPPEPHIVRVLDYGADQNLRYLVAEHVEGDDVKSLLQEVGPFTVAKTLDVSRQVAQALEHANDHGIVHCDIKPQNIVITSSGMVKLLDLGMARAESLPSLTQTGFVGSLYYISPEQAMGRHIDIRAGVYALGIIMYEMLAGMPPFSANTPWIIVNMHISGQFIPLAQRRPDLPEDVEWLVSKAMAREPRDRFQTPSELGEAIEWVSKETRSARPEERRREETPPQQPVPDRRDKDAPSFAVDDPKARQRQERVMVLYGQGLLHYGAREWHEAQALLEEVAELASNYRDTDMLLAVIGERLAEGEASRAS